MGKSINEIIATLPADRQKKIEENAKQKALEMIAQAESIDVFRKALGQTQAQVARQMGIKQNAVSQLEKRSDMYLSTLQKYVRSLGMSLELSLITKQGYRIELNNFHPWDHVSKTSENK